ncbi:putative signal-transduction protein with CBS domains [Vulcanisaeta moutnovskia 768-28]|uniref:Signal-transduction protein with CBS domains n=1 Tax=Vulcanisaeta moutnovskia (strain 768-28) TaxID=985053 RepID=F0QYW5_VULM7|nr:CBS domain-containing protein [Vulcanisaeta moutnovskia]ADY00246.1 putative signal-transduction protein with CBS domains [Vulcanisaeta moutnovskia 768-28]
MSTTVDKVLRRKGIIIDEDKPLKIAIELMTKENTDYLVVTGKNGKILGIVTANDILRTIVKTGRLDVNVGQCCSYNKLVTIRLNDSIYKAALIMSEYGVRHLLVVDDSGKPYGVLTSNDVICEDRLISRMAELAVPKPVEEYDGGAD